MSAQPELSDTADSPSASAPTEGEGSQPAPTPERPSLKARVRRALVVTHSTPAAHRLVPAPVALRGFELFAARARRARHPLYLEHLNHHRELLRYTPLAGEEERIAERALAEFLACLEIFWRPWLMRRGVVTNLHHAREAQSQDRGVLMIWPHFGVGYSLFPTLVQHDIPIYLVSSPHLYVEMGDGYDGRFTRFSRNYVDELGLDHVIKRRRGSTASGAFEPALDVLRRGDTLGTAFDVVGSMPTPFLGRRVRLASGNARLAHDTGSLVLPVVTRRRGTVPVAHFEKPIDARDFPDPQSLQAEIAGVMERWALEQPEAVWELSTQPGGPPLTNGRPLSEVEAG